MSGGNGITYVGMDAHKKAINVAVHVGAERRPVAQWQIVNEARSVKQMIRKVQKLNPEAEIHCAYEAGPCGYALQRQLGGLGVDCMVVAPSLIPKKPGERIKTDKRDAAKLSELLRAGLLTEVHPPTEEDEAVRDLTRAREDAVHDLMRAKHRLSKMLLRKGFVYREGRNWTRNHWIWIRKIRMEHDAAQRTLDNYILVIEQTQERLRELTASIEEIAQGPAYRECVGWLRCLRGIDTMTAMIILSELHDFRRFAHPRELMSYLGLTPSEHSSSDRVRRGSITRAGNSHVRRALVETAWNCRYRPSITRRLKERREGQPMAVIAIADRAQTRLHKRFFKLKDIHRKHHNVVVVAIARELAGFIWAILRHQDIPSISSN